MTATHLQTRRPTTRHPSRYGAIFVPSILLVLTTSAFAASPAQIRATIDKAKAYLYEEQKSDGTWDANPEIHGNQKTGPTALAVYALLASGESHQDKKLAPAIAYLKKTDTTGVYALGLRCQVWLSLPPTPDVRAAAMKDARLLVQSVKRTGEGKGFYNYNPSGGTAYSHSRAQYAVLGLWAASQMGIDVPREYWQLVESAWIGHQDASGAWNYIYQNDAYPFTPGMTAVGVATLFITQDFVHASDGLSCAGNIRNPAIDRGMKWLTDNFDKVASVEEYKRAFPYSTLYAIERIGVAGGYKYFGDVDWYQKGAEYLVGQQRSNGSFPMEFEGAAIAPTCLAMLFLSRGSAPLVMNKLDYSAASDAPTTAPAARKRIAGDGELHWNQRPRDVANATRWIGKQIERDLNWQIVNLNAPVDDLLDAPILYLAGNQSLVFTPEQDAKIREYVERGGMVVGNADCASNVFATGFKALGERLFPVYEFRPLPETHAIYTNQQFIRSKWKHKPNVLALGNGAREFMILLPDADPSRAWQTQNPTGKEELFQLAGDIYLYAVDKQGLRRRGESEAVTPDPKTKPTRTIKLARLQYGGNWNPEPGGWRRLSAEMHNADKIALDVQPVKLGEGKLSGYKLAHLTGTVAFRLEPAEREELKQFIRSGGTLIVDAAGGSGEFTSAMETELAAILPEAADQLKDVIPPSDPLYTAGGYKLKPVGFRNYARVKLGLMKSPQLRGIRLNNRLAVIFSREDLSVGLVGQSVDGIIGYDPATATALMERSILFTSPAPTTGVTTRP